MAAPALIVPIFPLPDVTFFPTRCFRCTSSRRATAPWSSMRSRRDRQAGRRAAAARLRDELRRASRRCTRCAGLGEIVSCERLATGRYNILLEAIAGCGCSREVPSDTLYRLVRRAAAGRRRAHRRHRGRRSPASARAAARCSTLWPGLPTLHRHRAGRRPDGRSHRRSAWPRRRPARRGPAPEPARDARRALARVTRVARRPSRRS